MIGVNTDATYDPIEFRAAGPPEQFLAEPLTVEAGQNLVGGTVVGVPPTSTKYAAYDNDAVATATTPALDAGNTGGGTISAVAVQDDYTLTEDWTLECTTTGGTGVGKFKVTGSVSGVVASGGSAATVGSEFKYPNTTAYMIKFTIADGSPDWTDDDLITFSTTRAEALVAKKILTEDVNALLNDVISAGYVKGNFVYSKLTGIDSNAVSDLNGVYDSASDRLRIN